MCAVRGKESTPRECTKMWKLRYFTVLSRLGGASRSRYSRVRRLSTARSDARVEIGEIVDADAPLSSPGFASAGDTQASSMIVVRT
jgi:hypothetical protein